MILAKMDKFWQRMMSRKWINSGREIETCTRKKLVNQEFDYQLSMYRNPALKHLDQSNEIGY